MLVIKEILVWDREALIVRAYTHPETDKVYTCTLRQSGGWYAEDIMRICETFRLSYPIC